MTFLEQLVAALVILTVLGHVISWVNAREIKRELTLSARLVATKLAESDGQTRAQLAEIYHKVNGRLDLALDKVTRLETALARERGEEPPPPNPLAAHAIQPTEE
ncbi:MAG TPA: hypothetical protein VGP44_11835 [Gemmatimonadales bacterium]|nr:hypothetical protein [Gemmatimonadales bacterium]